MATLATYKELVQNEVHETTTIPGEVIERGLQDTYQEILKHVARFLVGTTTYSVTATPGNQEYTPTAFYDIVRVLWHDAGVSDFHILKQITEEEAIEKYYNADNGTPTMFYQNGNKLVLVVTPDNAGTLEVVYVPVKNELTGDEVSVIPDRYTNVIIPGAISRILLSEGMPESVEYQAKYVAALQDMKKELSTRFEVVKPSFMGR